MMMALTGCGKGKLLEEYHRFSNLSWNRFDILTFETNLEKQENLYDISLAVRHLPEYPYDHLDIHLTIISPDGSERSSAHTIEIKDKEGRLLGKGLGDYWDVVLRVMEGITLTGPGKLIVEIENKMTRLETPGIIEIGLIIRESKQKY